MANQSREARQGILPTQPNVAAKSQRWTATKISKLEIQSFRGVTNSLAINLTDRDDKPTSLLMLGDNGTGKTSIVDAVEFALRGRVSRRGNAGTKVKREARDLLHLTSRPNVIVEVGGNRYQRGRPQPSSLGKRLGRELVPGFHLAPVTISRADIDVFWRLEDRERLRFFFDYLRGEYPHPGYQALEAERLGEAVGIAETAVMKAQIALATAADIPISNIPVNDRVAFYQWRARQWPAYVTESGWTPYGASPPKRIKAIRRLPHHIQRANSDLAAALETRHDLREQLEAATKAAGGTSGALPSVVASELPALLAEVSNEVSSAFLHIAKLPHVTKIVMAVGDDERELRLTCSLTSGKEVDPRQILSEGALDLLALLLMLEVARACTERGQSPVLVLDDVWQSVDTVHRTAVLAHIFDGNFKKWQLLITVHDRLWARLIEDKARRQGFPLKTLRLVAWSPEGGPVVRQGYFGTPAQLEQQIENSEADVLVGYAGKALEELADILSASMRVSVTRVEGDRYTLEALWPPVYSAIRKADLPSGLKEPANRINDLYVLRNTAGAHFNEWAQTLSDAEARSFASSVQSLWIATHCSVCGATLTATGIPSGPHYAYRCKHPVPETLADAGPQPSPL
ncbi:AAA family ATPase [Micromonospora chersina]|uniref:AAA family ATPase n=1 Tax=Micromonospora chersina TaxID=47854 RepID=UPI0033DF8CD4